LRRPAIGRLAGVGVFGASGGARGADDYSEGQGGSEGKKKGLKK